MIESKKSFNASADLSLHLPWLRPPLFCLQLPSLFSLESHLRPERCSRGRDARDLTRGFGVRPDDLLLPCRRHYPSIVITATDHGHSSLFPPEVIHPPPLHLKRHRQPSVAISDASNSFPDAHSFCVYPKPDASSPAVPIFCLIIHAVSSAKPYASQLLTRSVKT